MTETTTLMAGSLHTEAVVEQHLVEQLVGRLGYQQRLPEDYDRALALDKGILLRFIQATQPEE